MLAVSLHLLGAPGKVGSVVIDMALGKVHELGNFIRDQRRNARLSLRKVSQMAGISNPYLSQIERGLRRPSAEILQAIAKALRLSAETLYVKAGILEERSDEADPVTALLRDRTITEKQRAVLLEIYQSFRHENQTPEPVRVRRTAKKTTRARPTKSSARTAAARKTAPARKTAGTRRKKKSARKRARGA